MGDRFFGIDTALVAPPSRQLLGSLTYVEDGLTVILDGSCLTAGCCGVMSCVTVTDRTVIWSDFFAPATRTSRRIGGSCSIDASTSKSSRP